MNKINYIQFILTLSCFVFHIAVATAQTTNEGMLYVSEGTQFSTLADLDNKPTGAFINDGEAFIYESFNNDGLVDFYSNTGLTRFIGSDAQLISGVQPSAFYNIYFDNTSAEAPFHLSGDIEAYGMVDFFEGIVDIDNHGGSFLFSTNADHVNTSDFSHVDGPVNKYGNTAFTYPIGDGGYYRFSGISAPTSNTANYRSKYYLQDPGVLYDRSLRPDIVELIDENEYWVIRPEDGTDDDVLITLSWRDVTTPEAIIAAPQEDNIHIVRWDAETNMWIDEGGVVNTDDQTVTTAVDKYGVFTLARVRSDDILPCDIVVYNAVTPNGDGINDYFLIDRSNSECADNLHVEVYTRWGIKVFETDNYGLNGNVFDGFSEGRATVQKREQLPAGTYFYILDYRYETDNGSRTHKKAGYLYLNGN